MKKFNHIWIFSDNIFGHEIQSRALALYLSDDIEVHYCSLRQPWLSFAPYLLPRFGQNIVWEMKPPNLHKNPEVIITCGRRMAALGKHYKKLINCKHIQILNPNDNPKNYDLLICPEHDSLSSVNCINIKGSLHKISPKYLKHQQVKPTLVSSKKSIALFIGNPSVPFFDQLDDLSHAIRSNFPLHNLIVCGSRRTPNKHFALIRKTFKHAQLCWLEVDDGGNPYQSLLTHSSQFVVTADSINMVCEACATLKPVIAIATKYISPKHKRFIDSISGHLSEFGKLKENSKPLIDLEKLSVEVINRL